jgi:hypothetical protein
MSTDQRIRIELTPEQRNQVKEASGKEIAAVDLRIDELEQRIAPTTVGDFHMTSSTVKASP